MPEPLPVLTDAMMRTITSATGKQGQTAPDPAPPVAPSVRADSPPSVKYEPYRHREIKIISTPRGGWGMIVNNELVGVAETDARMAEIVGAWATETAS